MNGDGSDLLKYISLLMTNDSALEEYIVDPITAAEQVHAFPQYISYETVELHGAPYVKQITVDSKQVTADLSNACYDLSTNPNADSVFWFYSINGQPSKCGPLPPSGEIGESFANYKLKSGDTVYWQVLAPDAGYGFQPCAPHAANQYALSRR